MLLTLRKYDPRHRGRPGDEGVAMAAVIGLMAVAAVVVVSLMTATVYSSGVTVATRSSVQAKAAAEAGIDATAALFKASGCMSTVPAGSDPKYTVAVYSGNATTQNTLGCTGGDYKRVVATGSAATGAVAGNTSGQTRKMEAVFYLPAASAPSPGYAILGGAATAATNNLQVNASGDVYVTTGDFNCSVAATITGSLFVPAGKIDLSNSCRVNGDVYARDGGEIKNTVYIGGNVTAPNGGIMMNGAGGDAIGSRAWIAGNLTAKGDVTINNATVVGNVTSSAGGGSINSNSRVGGDLRVKNAVNINGTIRVVGMVTSSSGASKSYGGFTVGSLRVASLDALQGGSTITGDVSITSPTGATTSVDSSITVGGDLRSAAKFNSWGSGPMVKGVRVAPTVLMSASGGYAQVSGLVAADVPAAPTTQSALDFPRVTYKPADWAAQGFTQDVWTAGSKCKADNNDQSMTNRFSAYGTATVVDTRAACPGGIEFANPQRIKLKANVAIIATKITTTNDFYVESGDGSTHTMWMMVPAAPTGALCPSGSGQIAFSVGHGSAMPLMLYGACGVTLSNSQTFPGQVWGSTLTLSNDITVDYVPIGIPGVTLTPVGGTPPPSAPSTLQLLSKRDTTG